MQFAVSVTPVSEHPESTSGCPRRRTSFVGPRAPTGRSVAALVAIGQKLLRVDLLHRPCCIDWKVSGRLVYHGSHSCYSRFDQIYLMQSSAFGFAMVRLPVVGYLLQLVLQHHPRRFLWLCQIFEICEWSVLNFLFLQSFSQHGLKDFELAVECECFAAGRKESFQTSDATELDISFQMVSHLLCLVSSLVQIDEVESLRNCRPLINI